MQFFFAVSFILICIAIFIIFKIDTKAIQALLQPSNDKPTIKQLVNRKEMGKIARGYQNITLALESMGQLGTLYTVVFISFIAVLLGVFVGITFFASIPLAIAFGTMLAAIPFIYIRIQYVDYKALILEQLETSISVITSSIERTDNIVDAFRENIDTVQKPLNIIFRKFIFSVDNSIDLSTAIDTMKYSVVNAVFYDWCDTLKLVVNDRTLKPQLRPIVNRITDIKIATNEAKGILYSARKSFKTTIVLSAVFLIFSYGIIPYVFNSMGTSLLFTGFLGLLLAIDILISFFMIIRAYLLTKDITFEKV